MAGTLFGSVCPSQGLPRERRDMGDELAAGGMFHWRRDAHLHAELGGL